MQKIEIISCTLSGCRINEDLIPQKPQKPHTWMLINKFLSSQKVGTDVRKGFQKFQKSRDTKGQGTRIFGVQQDSFERKFAVINASITNKQQQ